jgi:D-alanyl-D-alanine carboxypeptidase
MSNDLAGHAIDMNVMHGPTKSQLCNSACLGGTLPAAVQPFIDAVRADAGLRWGGDFTSKDPVHIDDHLNEDQAAWTARRDATQAARASGCG